MINGSIWTAGIRVYYGSKRGSVEDRYTLLIIAEPNSPMPKKFEIGVIRPTDTPAWIPVGISS